jgi:hypothetical protein
VVTDYLKQFNESFGQLGGVKKELPFALTSIVIEVTTADFQSDIGRTRFSVNIYTMCLPDFSEAPSSDELL